MKKFTITVVEDVARDYHAYSFSTYAESHQEAFDKYIERMNISVHKLNEYLLSHTDKDPEELYSRDNFKEWNMSSETEDIVFMFKDGTGWSLYIVCNSETTKEF